MADRIGSDRSTNALRERLRLAFETGQLRFGIVPDGAAVGQRGEIAVPELAGDVLGRFAESGCDVFAQFRDRRGIVTRPQIPQYVPAASVRLGSTEGVVSRGDLVETFDIL